MPYPSPADERGNGGCLLLLGVEAIAIVAVIASLLGSPQEPATEPDAELPILYDEASDGSGMTVKETADGPIYDAPEGFSSAYVHDRENRQWVLVWSEDGVAMVPSLDADGEQTVTPRP